MTTLVSGYRGLSLLMALNFDRLIYLGTVAVALAAGGYLGSVALESVVH